MAINPKNRQAYPKNLGQTHEGDRLTETTDEDVTFENPVPVAGLYKIAGIELAAQAPSFDFQSIPQDFKHLRIVARVRSIVPVGNFDNFRISCNNDTTDANYFYQSGQVANLTWTGQQNIGAANSRMGVLIQGGLSPANLFSSVIIDILDYTKSGPKVLKIECDIALSFTSGNIFRRFMYLIWNGNAPLNRIMFECVNAQGGFIAGSSVDLYGVEPGFM